tara:strand:+ start:194 stop:415 length:222 start_codon:yes stop_codon:yes gene_type:complete
MRNKPLPGMMKNSPLHNDKKPLNAKGEEQSLPVTYGFSQSMKKIKKSNKGYAKTKGNLKMKPPYKRPVGPRAN